jgi:hypothetical protein
MILAGVYKNGEGPSALLTLPEAAWELSLGIYCAWKGFRTSSPLAEQIRRSEAIPPQRTPKDAPHAAL